MLLKEWRVEQELSQFQAAVVMGMHPQQLSRYERGVGTPGRKSALSIAQKTKGLVSVSSWDECAEGAA